MVLYYFTAQQNVDGISLYASACLLSLQLSECAQYCKWWFTFFIHF